MTTSGPGPRLHGWRAGILVALGVLAVSLIAIRPAIGPVPPPLAELFGAAVAIWALLVALTAFPVSWLTKRLADTFEDLTDADYGIWYVVLAAGHFALAQTRTTIETWLDAPSVEEAIRASLLERLTGFSADSFMNALWASLWPFDLLRDHDWWAVALLAGATWLTCHLGGKLFGEPALPGATGTDD